MGYTKTYIIMKIFLGLLIGSAYSSAGKCGDYGCCTKMDTTGCSSRTGGQDGCGAGIACSKQMAKTDNKLMSKYERKFKSVGRNNNIDAGLLTAICSRESRAGGALNSQGWGDCHGGTCYGFGLMQIDKRYHNIKGAWDSEEHINQATGIFIDMINCVRRNHPSWKMEVQTKGGLAAYNSGCGNVQTEGGMDVGTTGNDYSSDCVARGQYYKSIGY